MMLPEFVTFKKIPRWHRQITITEKIDGTNAQIYISEDGDVIAGSRNRWLLPDQADNFGFRAWVHAHADELREALGPGRHYGEWYGEGIQRRYGLTEKRFALFNTARWPTAPAPCHVVPVLYQGILEPGVVYAQLLQLRNTGSVAVSGWMKPEGIVVYHEAAGQYFKILLENDELPKALAA